MTEIDIRTDLCEAERPRADCPWRRFFARSIDTSIITLLWYAVAYLGFRWNLTGRIWLNIFVYLGLMILLEPPVLALFGTTPGKAVFGIRVTNPGGARLTLLQGYERIWRVFSHGYGYSIPIYNIVRQYKSYKECKESGVMEWDEDLEYTVKDRSPIRPLVYLVCALALGAATILIPYAADMPKHRGGLTVMQFADNMNRSLQYNKVEGSVGMLSPGQGNTLAAVSPDLWMPPPKFHIIESDGIVTEVTMEINTANLYSLNSFSNWIYCGVNAFVGAQRGMNPFNMHFGEIKNMLSGWRVYDSYSYAMGGVEVLYNIEIDGRPMADMQYSVENVTASSAINVYFTMRRVK